MAIAFKIKMEDLSLPAGREEPKKCGGVRDNDQQPPRLGLPRAPWSRASSPYERRDSLITFNFQYLSNYFFSTGIVSFRWDISPYLIELFWNNTKSLHFVLPLRILTVTLSSVLILKKMPSFLPTSTTMLFIQIDNTFWESSPKSVVLP